MTIKKTIMMIGGGIQEVKAVQIAQSSGYKVIVTDRNKDAPCFAYADYAAVIDGRDIERLIAYTLLNKKKLNITGVFTLTELITSVAIVATAAELPSVSLSSAVACQNKQLCKKIWKSVEVPTPKGGCVDTFEDALNWFDHLNEKIFVKPPVGFGSINTQKIVSKNELKQFFNSVENPMMIEELVDGSMHDVNAVFDANGMFVPLGCFDRFFEQENQVETGAVYPSSLSPEQIQQAYDLTESAARTLGINWGPVKSDLVLSGQGFMVFEIATRIHGPKGSLFLTSMVDELSHLQRILGVVAGDCEVVRKIEISDEVAAYEIVDHPGRPFSRFCGVDDLERKGFELLQLNSASSRSNCRDNRDVVGYLFGKGEKAGPLRIALRSIKKGIRFE
jgi:biotin carboxylase